MTTRQIESCTERLRQVDGYAAEHFRLLMREATKLHKQATALRLEAWANYRAVLNIEKRDDSGRP